MLKSEAYEAALAELRSRLCGERDMTADLANAAAVLYEHMENVNWLGFYIYRQHQLVLGPFQGRAAVTRIDIGSGVCGTAFAEERTLVVEDVHSFPGHIACDLRSRSEIVVPLRCAGRLAGVLDIDSPVLSRFDSTDRIYLEKAAELLGESFDI